MNKMALSSVIMIVFCLNFAQIFSIKPMTRVESDLIELTQRSIDLSHITNSLRSQNVILLINLDRKNF